MAEEEKKYFVLLKHNCNCCHSHVRRAHPEKGTHMNEERRWRTKKKESDPWCVKCFRSHSYHPPCTRERLLRKHRKRWLPFMSGTICSPSSPCWIRKVLRPATALGSYGHNCRFGIDYNRCWITVITVYWVFPIVINVYYFQFIKIILRSPTMARSAEW